MIELLIVFLIGICLPRPTQATIKLWLNKLWLLLPLDHADAAKKREEKTAKADAQRIADTERRVAQQHNVKPIKPEDNAKKAASKANDTGVPDQNTAT